MSKAGNGLDLTVAHGGWLGATSFERYDRFTYMQSRNIPANMLGFPLPARDGEPREIARGSTARGVTRQVLDAESDGSSVDGSKDGASDSEDDDVLLETPADPPGFEKTTHLRTNGVKYYTWSSDGATYRSRVGAWRAYREAEVAAARSPSASVAGESPIAPTAPASPASTAGPASPPLAPPPSAGSSISSSSSGRLQGRRRSRPRSQRAPRSSTVVSPRIDQCGNPGCTARARNGSHAGPHVFPSPKGRRRWKK